MQSINQAACSRPRQKRTGVQDDGGGAGGALRRREHQPLQLRAVRLNGHALLLHDARHGWVRG